MKKAGIFTRVTSLAFAAMLSGAIATPAQAATVDVQMLNSKGDEHNLFDPGLVRIKPGDSVHFIATDKGHSVQSIKTMMPDGAPAFTGQMGHDLTVKLDTPGVYGYSCMPHYGMGMVGLIVVGKPENESAAKTASAQTPGLAKERFTRLFTKLDSSSK